MNYDHRDEGNKSAWRSARAEKCEGLNASYVPTRGNFPITTSGIPLRVFPLVINLKTSAVKSVDNLCLILKRTVFRIGCSTETLAILPPSTTIRTYVFTNNNFVKKNRCDDHANMVFAHKLIESLRCVSKSTIRLSNSTARNNRLSLAGRADNGLRNQQRLP